MHITDNSVILSKMAELSREFRETGKFRHGLLKQAQEVLGATRFNWSIIREATKVSTGLYQVDTKSIPEAGAVSTIVESVATKIATPELVSPRVDIPEKLTHDRNQYIPSPDPLFVDTNLYSDIYKIAKSGRFAPVFITGESGMGKSSCVVQVHAKLKKPLVRFSMTKRTDEETMIGSKTLVDGSIKVNDGPVVIAMRLGATLLIDEIDAADPNTIMCLQIILEGRDFLFSQKNEIIKPAPGFNVIVTGNTKGKGSSDGRYIGTNVLNEAFLDRFAFTFEAQYPNQTEETKILAQYAESLGCRDDAFISTLVKWAVAIRAAAAAGAVDEIITTRRLKHILTSYSIYANKKKSINMCISRFDPAIKEAFLTLYTKITPDDLVDSPVDSPVVAE